MEAQNLRAHKPYYKFQKDNDFDVCPTSAAASSEIDFGLRSLIGPERVVRASSHPGSGVLFLADYTANTEVAIDFGTHISAITSLNSTQPTVAQCSINLNGSRDLLDFHRDQCSWIVHSACINLWEHGSGIMGPMLQIVTPMLIMQPNEAARSNAEIHPAATEISLREAAELALKALHEAEQQRENAAQAEAVFLATFQDALDEDSNA